MLHDNMDEISTVDERICGKQVEKRKLMKNI